MLIQNNLTIQEKLKILTAAAKFDVSCTSSGVQRKGKAGSVGSASEMGICHSFSADGRCISLLKILFTNQCIYDCKYCINRCSNDVVRTSFTPEEIGRLTMEFYCRNYIEGLFLSSGILYSADYTMDLLVQTLWLLRKKMGFGGYIHVKAIPGADPSLIEQAGFLADRMSVNLELPTAEGLKRLAPGKTREKILTPMKQIQRGIAGQMLREGLLVPDMEKRIDTISVQGGRRTEIERTGEVEREAESGRTGEIERRAESRRTGEVARRAESRRTGEVEREAESGRTGEVERRAEIERKDEIGRTAEAKKRTGIERTEEGAEYKERTGQKPGYGTGPKQQLGRSRYGNYGIRQVSNQKSYFVPAGQSTQMIVGATPESDYQMLMVAEALYRNFGMKRVFYSAYVSVNEDSALPALPDGPPLLREHRLYQADWLMRYYGFDAGELLSEKQPNFNVFLDPKCDWALRHLEQFPVEVNRAGYEMLLRVPGMGIKSVKRIIAARKSAVLGFEDLKRMGVVLKRAQYFITCSGKLLYPIKIDQDFITSQLLGDERRRAWDIEHKDSYRQLSLFDDMQMPYA